jgi:hypothetical protein
VDKIKANGGTAIAIQADVSNEAQVIAIFQETVEKCLKWFYLSVW